MKDRTDLWGPVERPESPSDPRQDWRPDSTPLQEPHPHEPRASWLDPVAAAIRPHYKRA
jgi:hypothetical protein